ncbi:sensor histidine kinase [Microbacterium halotolerans]|uniref:sensor histidine kinase n=1 Tax=Microbacterium halotolerans TaxID=246613 RepID=UPI000E6AC7E7|nr:histidine kinase [Microbacterium halotolerans]
MQPSGASPSRVVVITASIVGTIVLFAFGWFVGFIELFNVPGAVTSTQQLTGLGALGGVVITAAWVTVFWRHRVPVLVLAAGAVLTVLGSEYLLLLIGGFAVATRRPGRLVRWVRWGVPAAVVGFALREAFGPWGGAVVWALADNRESPVLEVVAPFVIATLSLGAYYGALALSRAYRRTDTATHRAEHERARADMLGDELERTRVREQVARELHDSLGQRLTMISFRSDEIETAAAAGDPRVVDFARSLRAETVRAADDLGALVNDLRTPLGHAPSAPAPTMRGIADIVRSHRAAGVRLETMILLEGLDGASDLLHQNVYRLVQEGLSNAVRHAPGCVIRIFLDGTPIDGVRLRIENDLAAAPGALSTHGAGLGATGMRERVDQIGGEIWIGEHEGRFIVDATLPWLTPDAS